MPLYVELLAGKMLFLAPIAKDLYVYVLHIIAYNIKDINKLSFFFNLNCAFFSPRFSCDVTSVFDVTDSRDSLSLAHR